MSIWSQTEARQGQPQRGRERAGVRSLAARGLRPFGLSSR
jgi:hypothetical protein